MSPFVVFEGPEGSGKSSQARALGVDLESRGHDVLLTREPGGTQLGDAIRQIVLLGSLPIVSRSEALLYCAARAQLVEEVLRPALLRGQVVISDRYGYSTLAYQGAGRGLELEALREVVQFATAGLEPDLCVLLDVDPLVGLERKRGTAEWHRFEREGLGFHSRVRDAFLRMAAEEPAGWVVLDASLPFDTVHDRIMDAVSDLLDRHLQQRP